MLAEEGLGAAKEGERDATQARAEAVVVGLDRQIGAGSVAVEDAEAVQPRQRARQRAVSGQREAPRERRPRGGGQRLGQAIRAQAALRVEGEQLRGVSFCSLPRLQQLGLFVFEALRRLFHALQHALLEESERGAPLGRRGVAPGAGEGVVGEVLEVEGSGMFPSTATQSCLSRYFPGTSGAG